MKKWNYLFTTIPLTVGCLLIDAPLVAEAAYLGPTAVVGLEPKAGRVVSQIMLGPVAT